VRAIHSACVSLFFQLNPGQRGRRVYSLISRKRRDNINATQVMSSGLCKLIHARNGAYGPINRVSGLPRAFSFCRRQTSRLIYFSTCSGRKKMILHFVHKPNDVKKCYTTCPKLAGAYILLLRVYII
jgi:hypothetical protein